MESVKIKVRGKQYIALPEDGCVIVTRKHYDFLKHLKIYWNPGGYAQICHYQDNKMKIKALHRYVVEDLEKRQIPKNMVVHHKDDNKYNNTIDNLEITTYAYNNTTAKRKKTSKTKFVGVYFNTFKNNWIAQVSCAGINYTLGTFTTDVEAAKAYDKSFYAIHMKESKNKLLNEKEKTLIKKNINQYIPCNKQSKRKLPQFVTKLPSGSFRVRLRKYNVDIVFKNLNEAIQYIHNLKQQKESAETHIIKRNEQGIAIIPVHNSSKNTIIWSMVSDEDYHRVLTLNWSLDKSGYAISDTTYMHRLIMNCKPHDGQIIDHTDNNKLNNTRNNLRFTTKSFNNRNVQKRKNAASRYLGVFWRNDCRKWRARIVVNGKPVHLGTFSKEEDAAIAYNSAFKKIELQETYQL
jgi:hypothetical protein